MTLHANVIAVIDGTRRYGFMCSEHYGQPGVHTVITQDGYHHDVPRTDTEDLAEQRILPSIRPTLVYRVLEAYTVDQPWETASNYTTYELQPGDYPIEWVTIGYHQVSPGDKPYYGQAKVEAIERRRHYVNRLLGASSVHDEYPNEPTTYMVSTYAYAMTPGMLPNGKAEIVVVEPARGEFFPAAQVVTA